jgi:hypothetical protein
MRHRKVTDQQLALANAALDMASSAVGLKRSFRRHAVTGLSGNPRRMRLGWLARAAFLLQLSAISFQLLPTAFALLLRDCG